MATQTNGKTQTTLEDLQKLIDSGDKLEPIAPKMFKYANSPDWCWVRLGELAEIVGCRPSELLVRYGLLSKFEPGWLVLTNQETVDRYPVQELIEICREYEKDGDDYAWQVFLPVGWSQLVTKAWSEGYTHVTFTILPGQKERPANWLVVLDNPTQETVRVVLGHKA